MGDLTKGFAELREDLQQVSRSTDEATRRKALEEGAESVVDRAKQLAPKRTGLLSRSGIVAGKNTGESIDIGWTADAFYGRFQEYGTSKMAPRPHLRPAWEQRQSVVLDGMARRMKLK